MKDNPLTNMKPGELARLFAGCEREYRHKLFKEALDCYVKWLAYGCPESENKRKRRNKK